MIVDQMFVKIQLMNTLQNLFRIEENIKVIK